MNTLTQKTSCPTCGVPVTMPQDWSGKNPDESLCNRCFEQQDGR